MNVQRKDTTTSSSLILSVGYLVLGAALLSYYGTKVCPYIDSLDDSLVAAVFALGFGLAGIAKLLIEPRFVDARSPLEHPKRQLIFDLTLYATAGIIITAADLIQFSFPIGSGIKVLLGCLTWGVFASIDNALLREREMLQNPPPCSSCGALFPITRKLSTVFSVVTLISGTIIALIVVRDIDFILQSAQGTPHAPLKQMVYYDIAFVVGILLFFSLRIIWSYSKNLGTLLEMQIDVLNRVASGDLEHHVPIVTRDEFRTIAEKTNSMIGHLKQARTEEEQLFEMARDLSAEIELRPLLTKIVGIVSQFLNAERSTLFLYEEKTGELWSYIAEGITEQEIRISATEGIVGESFTKGTTVNVPDAYADPRFHAETDLATGYKTRCLLAVPIRDKQGKCIGVLEALNKKRGTFSKQDEMRLRSFCGHAAVALINAQLFDEVSTMKNYNEAVLKSLSNGVVTLDEDFRIVKANEAAISILGTSEKIVGATLNELFTNSNAWIPNTAEQAFRTTQATVALDESLRLPDGKLASLNLTAAPLFNLENEAIGTMLVIEDISSEKRVRATMSRYMTKEVADRLLEQGETVLGGISQEVTVLFSDIYGFTSISEELGPRETVSMLNEYFTVMADKIFEANGVLDKYVGDAIMAVFGVPFISTDDADNSLIAGINMLTGLQALNNVRARAGKSPIEIGIGINTGEVVVGNIGSPKRMDYTVIGDTVNLSARLESATRTYGSRILISEFTKKQLKGKYLLREIDRICVKGKKEAIRLYEALDYHTQESFPQMENVLQHYFKGLDSYTRCEWQAGLTQFTKALEIFPNDGPSKVYAERCTQFLQHPPADNWDGVWVMQGKA